MSQDKYGVPSQKSFGVTQAIIGGLIIIKFFYNAPWGGSMTESQTPSCYTPCPSCLCLTEQSSQYRILYPCSASMGGVDFQVEEIQCVGILGMIIFLSFVLVNI